MGMKFILKYSSLLFLCTALSCKKEVSKDSLNTIIDISKESIEISNTKKSIKNFYETCYTNEIDNHNLFGKFITKRLNSKINELRSSNNVILDYDPFIKGQDFDADIIMKTLKVKLNSLDRNEYKVSFNLFELDNEEPTVVFLHIEEKKGNFLIGAINNDQYLNYDVIKNINEYKEKRREVKENERIKSFVQSCGGGCAITYNEIKVSIIDSLKYNSKMKILTYINQEIINEEIVEFKIICKNNKVISVRDNDNVDVLSNKNDKSNFREYFNQICSCSTK